MSGSPITPDTRLALLDGRSLVISSAFLTGSPTPIALRCTVGGSKVTVRYAAIRGDSGRTVTVAGFRRLHDFARQYLDITTVGRITPVTDIEWGSRLPGHYLKLTPPAGLTFDDLYPGLAELSPEKLRLHAYVLGSVAAPEDEAAPEVALERMAGFKAEYGALLSDVVYRISNPALFDATVAESRAFHLLLMQWDDAVLEATGGDLDALSREVALAFDTARANAERVGLDHLPWRARSTARKAVKAAELAENATTDGERAAARDTITKLLRSMALHYLPLPSEAPRMLGGAQPALDAPKAQGQPSETAASDV